MTNSVDPAEFILLQQKVEALEARVAALTAFACAMLDANPRRDELQTRWAMHISPALTRFAALDDIGRKCAATVPAWIDQRMSEKPRTS